MKQRVVDSVTIEAAYLKTVDQEHWSKIETRNNGIQATDFQGFVLEVDSNSLKTLKKSPAVFQTCSECKKKITRCYRSIRKGDLEVVFVWCSCGHYPVVVKSGVVVGRLTIMFDSTRVDDDVASEHFYNRSVWSTSTALLYCEKTSRLVVEYQWKDLEAGQFDKHSVKLSGIYPPSKTADIVPEGNFMTQLLKDGRVVIRGSQVRISGTLK